jgi:hypothetical protein
MKGRRRELTREELHAEIADAMRPAKIMSEYGMTELLSQAYCSSGQNFIPAPWMRALCRPPDDPLSQSLCGKGALNIMDLANVHSCSFIATQDIGEVYAGGSFSVQGRIDSSQIRGCNLMVS